MIIPASFDVQLLEPQEVKRGDGRRGVTFARLNRELIVIPLAEGETWIKCEFGGLLIIHPQRRPVWCRVGEDGHYLRNQVEIQ